MARLDPQVWAERILADASDLGISLSQQAVDQSWAFLQLLAKWGQRMDLSTVIDPAGATEVHLLDSWMAARHIPEGSTLVDIGSGAGLPGLALKILRPDIQLVSVESRAKRCVFQRTVVRELGLSGVEVREQRAEAGLPEPVAVATARAVADLPVLLELAGPLLAPEGRAVFFRGPNQETPEDVPGWSLEEHLYTLPSGKHRRLVVAARST